LRANARGEERFAMALQGQEDSHEIIWGAKAIGALIGLSERKTFHLLETGQIKGAKKFGRRWCITRQNLMANFDPSPTTDNEEP
jgi:hypothetical protein